MKTSIKTLAKEAKQRMCEGQNPENKGLLADMLQEEERVYRLVCRLRQESGIVTDPIRRIAQPSLWNSLQGVRRERYVLCLSDLYLRMCDRYRREHEGIRT